MQIAKDYEKYKREELEEFLVNLCVKQDYKRYFSIKPSAFIVDKVQELL